MGMINITDIEAGWATLTLGYCSFDVSYLSDLVAELDALFCCSEIEDKDMFVRKIILEGEGHGDLSLVAYLTFNDVNQYLPTNKQYNEENKYDYIINIVWQKIFCGDEDSITILKFPYRELLEQYKQLKEVIKEDYVTNFLCPQSEEEKQTMLRCY